MFQPNDLNDELMKILEVRNKSMSTNQPIWLSKQRGNRVAHTLQFRHNVHGTHVVDIAENSTRGTWIVMYRDNSHIIVDNELSDRRVYHVREWIRCDQCRATRLE